MASTGPSQTIQVFHLLERWLDFYQSVENIPGVQSSEISDFTPYNYSGVIALGFKTLILYYVPNSVKALVRIYIAAVLPQPVGPTSINPCRTINVSYN